MVVGMVMGMVVGMVETIMLTDLTELIIVASHLLELAEVVLVGAVIIDALSACLAVWVLGTFCLVSATQILTIYHQPTSLSSVRDLVKIQSDSTEKISKIQRKENSSLRLQRLRSFLLDFYSNILWGRSQRDDPKKPDHSCSERCSFILL